MHMDMFLKMILKSITNSWLKYSVSGPHVSMWYTHDPA